MPRGIFFFKNPFLLYAKNMNLEELKETLSEDLIQANVVIVDVRTHEERALSSIKNTIHIPLNEILLAKDSLEKYSKIIFLCAHGRRAQMAMAAYESLGVTNVDFVDGAIEDWAAYQLPLETSKVSISS